MPSIDPLNNAITLDEYARISENPVTKGVIAALYDTQSLLKYIPLSQDPSLKARGIRLTPDGLPNVGWGQLNKAPDTVKARFDNYEEAAYLIRNNISVDRRYRNQKGYSIDPVKAQTMAYMEASAYELNTRLIINDPAAPGGKPDAPPGLKVRLDNPTLYGGIAECKFDANAVDAKAGTMTVTSANALIRVIDRLLNSVNSSDGNNCLILVNDELQRSLNQAARMLGGGGGFNSMTDGQGRIFERFRNAKIVDVGRMADQVTRIIPYNENAAGVTGGADDRTSMYVIRFGGNYVTGWHDGNLNPTYVGKDDTGTQDIFLIDYLIGLFFGHSRSIARAFNIEIF